MLRALACAITFLTRIPLPAQALDERAFAASAGWFAWVGGLIGLILWAVALIFGGLGARIAALLVVVAWAFITGGLHLDGLADTVDGFSGGRADRARTLAVMRDSRIGAHGAVALCLLLALKWALLEPLLAAPTPGWLMAPVSARFGCTLLMACFPYARPTGLGSAFASMLRGRLRAGVLALGVAACLACGLWLGLSALLAGCAGVLCAALLALRVRRLLGGLTGDIYGAAIELSEVTTLLALDLLALR